MLLCKGSAHNLIVTYALLELVPPAMFNPMTCAYLTDFQVFETLIDLSSARLEKTPGLILSFNDIGSFGYLHSPGQFTRMGMPIAH